MSASNMPKKDDRIRLIHMGDDPDPVPHGTEGTVLDVTDLCFPGERQQYQILVRWDNGRSLSCVCPPDVVQVLEPALTSGSSDH